jgi:hypothetical protein
MTLWAPSNYSAGILKEWHDPSDTGSITTVSGFVSVDADKSGNSNDNSSGSGLRPTYTTSGINSLNVETFNPATPNWMSGVLDYTTLTQWSLIWVIQITSGATYKYLVSANAASGEFEWRISNVSKQEILKGNVAVLGTSTSALSASTPTIIQVSYNPTSGAWSFRKNGTADGSGTATSTLTSSPSRIASSGVSPTFYFDGIYAERIHITSVTLSDIQLAEGYLAWKWGTVSSLDASHPYKSAAPTVGGGTSPFIFPRSRHYVRR